MGALNSAPGDDQEWLDWIMAYLKNTLINNYVYVRICKICDKIAIIAYDSEICYIMHKR